MQNIFSALEEVSKKLGQKTKTVDALIAKVNDKLSDLNLVSDVWLSYSPIEATDYEDRDGEGEKCPRFREVTLLGCCCRGKSWKLTIKQATQTEDYELLNSHGLTDLSSASEDTKLKAARLIPELLDEVKSGSESFLDELENTETAAGIAE